LWVTPLGTSTAPVDLLQQFTEDSAKSDNPRSRSIGAETEQLAPPNAWATFINRIPFTLAIDPSTVSSDQCSSFFFPSVQNPDLSDYELSPGSFVTTAGVRLGDDSCEWLVPSTAPTHESFLFRVITRSSRDRQLSLAPQISRFDTLGRSNFASSAIQISPIDVTISPSIPTPLVRFGEVLNFRQRWYQLGHSLGEIKYSLALAPGETVEIAVVDWSRKDTASRTDTVHASEFLSNNLNRDRSITEVVNSMLAESQDGWSVMGGTAGAASGAYSYVQWAGDHSVGGGIAHSSGVRNLEADSLQDLHDHVGQTSSYVRGLDSTVIIQATQSEQNVLQTRRVANHNHCHALTIQYYEVLRHFRVATEFVGRRKAVLIPFAPFAFDWDTALKFETILSPGLLDATLAEAFAAIKRCRLGWDGYRQLTATPIDKSRTDTGSAGKYFTGKKDNLAVYGTEALDTGLYIQKGSTVRITATGTVKKNWRDGYQADGSGDLAPTNFWAPGKSQFSLVCRIGAEHWYQGGTNAEFGPLEEDGYLVMVFNDAKDGMSDNDGYFTVSLDVLPPPDDTDKDSSTKNNSKTGPDKNGPSNGSDANIPTREGDAYLEAVLLKHLNSNRSFYISRIWSMLNPSQMQMLLEAALASYPAILDGLDSTPLAISGNYVAFPYDGPQPDWQDVRDGDPSAPIESILSLPTPGIFAEAMLSHCNACEERDVTRMWDWREMTVEEPPAITGITPGPRGSAPDITPTQLPQNVIQITQPPAAPDPTGLAAALRVMGTPNIFRDITGLQEVGSLLNTLASGAVTSLAGAQKLAQQAQQKLQSLQAQQQQPMGGGAQQQESRPTAAQTYDNLTAAKAIAKSAKDLGWTPQTTEAVTSSVVGGNMTDLGTGDSSGIQQVSWPAADSSGSNPQKLLSGDAASLQAAQLLQTAQPVTLPNNGVLRPGTIWNDHSILVSADWTYAYYLKNGDLYQWNTSQFMRDELLTAWQQGVSSASTWIYLSDVEISLLAGMFVGPLEPIWVGPLVLAGATFVDSGLKLYHNRAQVSSAYQASFKVVSALGCIRANSPELWDQLEKATFNAILDELMKGPSLKTVAFWLGRIMRGVAMKMAPDLVLGGIIKIAGTVAGILTALHAPGVVGQALENAIAGKVADIKSAFAGQGVQLSDEDAKALLRSMQANDQVLNCLNELGDALNALQPLLTQLVPQVLQ
jgi:hypothetical protein